MCCWTESQQEVDSGTSVGDQCTNYSPQREGLPVRGPVSQAGGQRRTTGGDCLQGSPGMSGYSQMSAAECPWGSCDIIRR